MGEKMVEVFRGPADWRGKDLQQRSDWIHRFTSAEDGEIKAALAFAKDRGKTLETITKDDFPIPLVAARLAEARVSLEEGPGVYQFRGLNISGIAKDDLRLLYWGLGKHMGTAVSQSKDGDLLGDVRNVGVDINSPQGRGYKSNQRLSFHTDSCDVVGLFVLRIAREGGLSLLASSVAIHNEMARQRPDLLEVLYQPFAWSWQTQEPVGGSPWYYQPLFSMKDGMISCRYIRVHIRNGERFEDAPRLTEKQIEALDYFDRLAWSEDFHFSFMFEPGDIQFLNNHVALHSRTAFEDWPEEDRRRHLLRMWMSVPTSRPLSDALSTIYADGRPGATRGGFPSRTGRYIHESTGALSD
jgi:hypothetical protein